MLEITREKAINMLVDYELDSLDSDELRDAYTVMAKNGTRGYNEFTDGNLAIQVELAFNETDGVRIVPPKEEQVRKAVEGHWNTVMPSFKSALGYDNIQQFKDEWVEDVMCATDGHHFNSADVSLGFQRTVLSFLDK